MHVCKSVLGDDGPWKNTIYHMTWLLSGNKAFTTTVTTTTTAKLLPVTHVLVDTWMLTDKPV